MLNLGEFTFEFIKRPETDWGNNLLKPISCCKITSKTNVGYGCAYCDEAVLEKVFSYLIEKEVGQKEEEDRKRFSDIFVEVLDSKTWPGDSNVWLVGNSKFNIDVMIFDIWPELTKLQISAAISGIDNALWSFISSKRGESLVDSMVHFLNGGEVDEEFLPESTKNIYSKSNKSLAYMVVFFKKCRT